jgi:long-chain acyl-CoA synthetase
VETARDLLREATEAGEAVPGTSPVERPEETLDETQKRRLEPLSPAESVASRGMFALNRVLMRGPFRLRVRRLENLPKSGPFVLAPNHVSYLYSFALAAALDAGRIRGTYGPAGSARPSATPWRVWQAVSRGSCP